ncbi:HalX domain-containing protein [Halomicrobium zhouii]|uniref:HalX domain-containing protein n=1 Tax=Halomicrobium zhouii TaxID=767519 RepID=A0A1I6K6E4_9EURY|nr:HalX domain-containing protein [Halomicrobium zhouii]SFR86766.1 HalX domain-containing protein [Halomicrobium zhouii]
MDRTYLDDAEVGIGTRNDAVLVCVTDGTERARLASVLRQDYPVRTADSESDALASLDGNVTVLVVDETSDEFTLDHLVETGTERDCRFQVAAIADAPVAESLRDRCDGVVEKPIDDQTLRTTVRWLHRRGRYDRTLATYYALSERYAELVTGTDATADELASVEEQLARLREELDDVGDSLEDGDAFEVALSRD